MKTRGQKQASASVDARPAPRLPEAIRKPSGNPCYPLPFNVRKPSRRAQCEYEGHYKPRMAYTSLERSPYIGCEVMRSLLSATAGPPHCSEPYSPDLFST